VQAGAGQGAREPRAARLHALAGFAANFDRHIVLVHLNTPSDDCTCKTGYENPLDSKGLRY
jgi:hypothetical protein